ncbi:TadE family type IV pilus minor pilin [Mycobacterium sp. C3-094]
MEAAFAILTLVAILAVCLAGLTAITMQVRCVDAAREAARLAARGDENAATATARQIAPPHAGIELRRDGGFAVATVTSRAALLPGVAITARAVSALEPGV